MVNVVDMVLINWEQPELAHNESNEQIIIMQKKTNEWVRDAPSQNHKMGWISLFEKPLIINYFGHELGENELI